MPAPVKFVTVIGCVGKTEASYGAGGSLSTSTDGIQLAEFSKFVPGYANEGARPAPPGTLGSQRKVFPSGKFLDALPMKHAPKMPGVAYASGVFFSAHNMLRWCGMDAAGSFVGGSEKWTYTPTPGPVGYASGVLGLYERGELWPATGVLGDFTWGFKGPEVPVFDFSFKGLLGSYTDVAVPAITYPYDARDALVATSLPAFLLFGVTQVAVREATLKLGRTFQPRLDVMSGGHLGWAPVRRNPTLELLLETPAIATQDWFSLYEVASNTAWALTLGPTQYNRMKWSGAGAQVMSPPKLEDDGSMALTRVTLQLNPSSLTANDDLQLITD